MGSQAVSHLTSVPRTPAIGQATLPKAKAKGKSDVVCLERVPSLAGETRYNNYVTQTAVVYQAPTELSELQVLYSHYRESLEV